MGAVMTLGQGALIAFSAKQKINTKSSTESEVVGVDDGMPLCTDRRKKTVQTGFVQTRMVSLRSETNQKECAFEVNSNK